MTARRSCAEVPLSFDDPDAVARYAENPPRLVPGFHDMQRMACLLLAESAPPDGHVLVLGAGGGLELKAFADWQPGWRLTGVDPSAEMLALASRTLGHRSVRVNLHQGYIDDAPPGRFDGAACLLTLHFIPRAARLQTLIQLRRRLKPGARLVVAHHSIPEAGKALWLNRHAGFAASSGVPEEQTRHAASAIAAHLPTLSPEQDEGLLRQAGFSDVALFYAAFTFRGWVATA